MKPFPRIVELRAFVLAGGGADYHDQAAGHWIDSQISTPMARYREYRDTRSSFGLNVLGSVVVEAEAKDGVVGVGVSTGGLPACFLVERHLSRFVEGQRADRVELMWDQMWRATLFYGRKGLALNALSAVDLALWDLFGKLRDEPVHALIGGAVREEIEFYATGPRPDLAKELGFIGGKLPLVHGPAEGDEGLRPYRFRWLEECLPPDDYWGYAELRRRLPAGLLLMTGEHEAGRLGFRMLIDMGCCDVVQPDVGWCGGLTELLKIAAYADAHDIPVVPHGSSVYSSHFVVTRPGTPFAEFLMMAPRADRVTPMFSPLFVDEPVPERGRLRAAALDRPGFGVELDRSLPLERPFEH